MQEPETIARLEAPAGVVEVRAACRDGRVDSIEVVNVPARATMLDAPLDVEGVARLSVDVAFGGMWYCIADASALGFAIAADEARELCEIGERIRLAAKEQLDANVSIVQIAQPWQGAGAVSRNAVVIAPGRLDRSATGTGLCARMAALHARGLMRVGDSMTHASPIGSTFDGRIVAETADGIVPAIRGSGFVTGRFELYVDERDPFPEGYLVSDTWPGSDLQ
jgi:proline racemase